MLEGSEDELKSDADEDDEWTKVLRGSRDQRRSSALLTDMFQRQSELASGLDSSRSTIKGRPSIRPSAFERQPSRQSVFQRQPSRELTPHAIERKLS